MFCWEKVKELYVRRKMLQIALALVGITLVAFTLLLYVEEPAFFGPSQAFQIMCIFFLIVFELLLPAFASETKAQRAFMECMKESFSAEQKPARGNKIGYYLEISSYYRKIIFGVCRNVQAKWAMGVEFQKKLPPFVAVRVGDQSNGGGIVYSNITALTNIKSHLNFRCFV